MAWKEVSKIFDTIWNFPHCVGALDGKHVVLQAPVNSGSDFFNYKSHFSIVLLAVVDGNYNFMFADVGCQGRISDGGVFKNSKLYKMINENSLGLPLPEELRGREMKVPYYFIGDSAFALCENLMKPYPGDHAPGSCKRIFNYRLSRARRVVENAFGISSSVFRVLRKPMLLEPAKAEIVVMSVIVLHNYLRTHSRNLYTPPGSLDHEVNGVIIEGTWRNDEGMTSMRHLRNAPKRSSSYVNEIRKEISEYCINEGVLPWQNTYA
ncbi:protein ALP1-like [Anoplophora glabripennis]|uniref:protein ALP1-like n=1 Tax=Anoplophora glabripennis TaxID=217634 RepID=UPI000C7705C2|nr:protein ALP1-like [Anoplophora glabripennis]